MGLTNKHHWGGTTLYGSLKWPASSVVTHDVAGYEVRISALLSENQWPLAALLLEEARHAGSWREDNWDLAGHLVHRHAKMSHL